MHGAVVKESMTPTEVGGGPRSRVVIDVHNLMQEKPLVTFPNILNKQTTIDTILQTIQGQIDFIKAKIDQKKNEQREKKEAINAQIMKEQMKLEEHRLKRANELFNKQA